MYVTGIIVPSVATIVLLNIGLGFNATFNNVQIYRDCQFYWWMKPKYPEKTTDLWQVTDTLEISHNGVSKTLRLSGIITHNITYYSCSGGVVFLLFSFYYITLY